LSKGGYGGNSSVDDGFIKLQATDGRAGNGAEGANATEGDDNEDSGDADDTRDTEGTVVFLVQRKHSFRMRHAACVCGHFAA
jgi:hypothetical protein